MLKLFAVLKSTLCKFVFSNIAPKRLQLSKVDDCKSLFVKSTSTKLVPVNLVFFIFKFENKPKSLNQFDQVQIDDTFLGLKAINNRVNGLMKFVESYRKLYKIPNPVFSNFMIQDVLDEIKSLYKEEFLEKNIHLEINNENQKTLFADKNMITQLSN